MNNGYTNMKDSLWLGEGISHYYGDYVRSFLIAAAALSFITIPLWGDLLPFGVVTQVGASLLLVLLAGLISPRAPYVMIAVATVSAVSILLLESAAIMLKGEGENATALFLSREGCVLLLLGALYFSVKTVRGMMAGKMGHSDTPLEFYDTKSETPLQAPKVQDHIDVSDYDA